MENFIFCAVKLRIWLHLPKKCLMESLIFCAVDLTKIVALPYIQKKSPRGVP